MISYIHDYTKAAHASRHIYKAHELMRKGEYAAAQQVINRARHILDEHLASDNIIEDNDEEGWYKKSDVDNEKWDMSAEALGIKLDMTSKEKAMRYAHLAQLEILWASEDEIPNDEKIKMYNNIEKLLKNYNRL